MRKELEEIVESLSNKLFIIEEVADNREDYNKFIDSIYDYLKAGFEEEPLRTCPVYFKFHKDDEIHTMQLRHFVTNLMFWEPFVRMDIVNRMDSSYIIDATQINSDYIKAYIDNKIIIPNRYLISNKKMNIYIADMIHNLGRISADFNIILGLSMNIEGFMEVADRNPRFNEILHTKLNREDQPKEIENLLNSLMEEEVQILLNEDSPLRPMLRAKSGIKSKQLAEFSIAGGLKPNLSGQTMPVPIDSNLVIGGLNSVSNYFIDSVGGNKALIMNKSVNFIAA